MHMCARASGLIIPRTAGMLAHFTCMQVKLHAHRVYFVVKIPGGKTP